MRPVRKMLPGFISRLFSRRPVAGRTPDLPAGDTPDDWQVGDLAECTLRGEWTRYLTGQPCSGPARGDILRVSLVDNKRYSTNLLGFGAYGRDLFGATSFRKITPRADQMERADQAFIEQLRRTPASPPLPDDQPEPAPPLPAPQREDAQCL